MSELMRASRQWSSRPNDERFWSVDDLRSHCDNLRANSKVLGAKKEGEKKENYEPFYLKSLRCEPNGEDISIVGPSGNPVQPTNWGFAQLCHFAGAPAKYLSGTDSRDDTRSSKPGLPSRLACECLNYGIQANGDTPVQLLLQRTNGNTQLRAITSPDYSRFWDSELCQLLTTATNVGWVTPPARPSRDDARRRPATDADVIAGMTGGVQIKAGDMIAPSGVYRGDRDSFAFLMNPSKPIDDGDGGLFKGFIASNSEVGNASIRFQSFSFQGVCGNHIIWGASNVCEIKRIHRGDIRPFVTDLNTWLGRYTDASALETEQMIRNAKQYSLGLNHDEVCERVHKLGINGLTQKAIEAAWNYADKWEVTAGATPNTAWGFVHGLTRYSQTVGYTDARQLLDVAGGKILSLAT
jgi:hypothetical protein